MEHYFSDPKFWVHASFFIFLLIVIIKGRGAVRAMLDGKISEILKEMENAQQLREEALGVLAEAKYKEQLAETRVRDMESETDEKIRNIEDEARQTLNRTLAMQRKRMDDKITRLENETKQMINRAIIECAKQVSMKILREDFHEAEDRVYMKRIVEVLPIIYAKRNIDEASSKG
ncbi:MAG: hypothetical protein K0U45_01515 [Alphaproteobacteria bacterium]|nr:hypothetical protein [Alphaproteobacteria bacterium]